jgi:site-specific recombinase XerD
MLERENTLPGRSLSILMVRQAKGKKDRMIPVDVHALAWIIKYSDDVRSELATSADDRTMFLTT